MFRPPETDSQRTHLGVLLLCTVKTKTEREKDEEIDPQNNFDIE